MYYFDKISQQQKKAFFNFTPTLLTKEICKRYHFYLDKCRRTHIMYALNLKNENVLKYKWVIAIESFIVNIQEKNSF